MRVTKLIKEYVTKKVKEAYPRSAEELAWDEHQKLMNDAITEANEKAQAYAEKLVDELNAKYGFDEAHCLRAYSRSWVTDGGMYDSEIYKAMRSAEDNRTKKIKETIEDILITLEMGGTRADLDEMLLKIGQGE